MKRRRLFRIDPERLPPVSVVKNPNNRQECAQVNDNRYGSGNRVRRSALIDGGEYICERPLRERRDCAV